MSDDELSAGSPLKEFVKQSIGQIDDAIKELGNDRIVDKINFKLKTTVSGDVSSGLNIYVVKLGADVKSEQVQEISFSADKKEMIERQIKNQELLLKKMLTADESEEENLKYRSG